MTSTNRYVYKTRPWPHQHRALRFLLRNGGGGLQVPMRFGKSKVGCDFAGATHLLRAQRGEHGRFPTKVLVITVVDGIEVWHNEIAKHCAVPWMLTTSDRAPEHGGFGQHIAADIDYARTNNGLWWRVINWESTYAREPTGQGREWVPVERTDLHRWRPDIVIVDESHHAGNPTAVQSKHAYRLCRLASSVVLMTGTMFHRKPFYVFGQAKLYDPGIFGSDWGHFKRRVAVMGGYGGYEVLRYRNLRWMMKRIRPWCYIEPKPEPLKAPVENVIPVHLTGRNLSVYKKMEADSIVKLDGAKATADIVLTKHLRGQQIAGGWVRTDQGMRRVGSCKLAIAESRLREYMEQGITKAVIGARFIAELADLAKLAKRIGYRPILFHGGLPKTGRARPARIALFNETEKPCLFIAQIQAARESIDLSSTDTMMLYSLSESYLDYSQFKARIEVFGDTRTLMYDHVIATGTRDEVTYQSMLEKRDVADFIADEPERVEAIVAANVDRRLAKRERATA